MATTQKKQDIFKVISEAAQRFKVETASSLKQEELLAFFKEAYTDEFNASDYHDEKKVMACWEWANLQNPNINNGEFPAWVCKDRQSNRVLGHFALIPVMLKFKDSCYPAVWGRDFIVAPSYRRSGVGSLLFNTVLKKSKETNAIFLLAGLNDYAVTIYKRLGFRHLGYVPLYARINRTEGILQNYIRNKALSIPLGIFAGFFLRLRNMIYDRTTLKYIRNKDILITEITSFDSSFDQLWEDACSQFSIIVRRNSSSLNWRFVNQPYWKYRIFKAVDRKNELKGYIVLREGKSRGLDVGVISDLFARADDGLTLGALLGFAVKHFKENKKINLIRCDILHRGFADILRKFGFIKLPSASHFMVTNVRRELDLDFAHKRDNWFINYADCDLDLYERR